MECSFVFVLRTFVTTWLKRIFQADELIKALEELENSASSDAAVRERIAALPPEVSDVTLLDTLKGEQQRQCTCILKISYSGIPLFVVKNIFYPLTF